MPSAKNGLVDKVELIEGNEDLYGSHGLLKKVPIRSTGDISHLDDYDVENIREGNFDFKKLLVTDELVAGIVNDTTRPMPFPVGSDTRKKEKFVRLMCETLVECGGNVSKMASKLGVSLTIARKQIMANPELMSLAKEIREAVVDAAETNIVRAVESGDLKASVYVLDRLGRNRGYTTKTEVSVNHGDGQEEKVLNLGNLSNEQLEQLADALRSAAKCAT